ncbi:hypothetical protein TWF506_010708 [Arthrobotrys conoides]|uniref:Uncharacterized protein n=1 Tax=Arthrobotrys conoides TaxID=74498 RepID=A0AAN8NI08_9PEZI
MHVGCIRIDAKQAANSEDQTDQTDEKVRTGRREEGYAGYTRTRKIKLVHR